MARIVSRRWAVAGAVIVVSAAGLNGWALLRDGEPAITYATAGEMARQAGCTDTFQGTTPFAGVVSAGRCRVAGGWVELRVLPSTDAAHAWVDGLRAGAGDRPGPSVIGIGWVAFSTSDDAMRSVVPALTSPRRG